MNLFARLFPKWAYHRRAYLEAMRLYDAATSSDYRPRRGGNQSGDAVVQHAGASLRQAARHYDENSDFAVAVLDELVGMTVGEGVRIEPMVRRRDGELDEAVNDQIRAAWTRFWEWPEVSHTVPGAELERLIARSTFRDGETFGVHHLGGAAPFPTAVPYVLEVLEADYCPFDLVRGDQGRITHGIERDAWQRPTAYHFYKQHPGALTLRTTVGEVKRVPAERVIHPKIVRRLGQARGVSILAPVLTRIDDIKEIEESERIAAKVAAALCAVIVKDSLPGAGYDTDKNRSFSMRPGMIFDNLLPGEKVETIDSKRPNSGLPDFLEFQIRRLAAGTTARYSAVARDYNGTYSSQRQELVEAKTGSRRWLSYFVATFYRPTRAQFIIQAIWSGAITLSPDTDTDTLVDAEYRGPAIPWIDPAKEMTGYQIATENRFMSREQVIRDLGGDPDQVDRQIARDPAPAASASPAAGAGGAGEGDNTDDDNTEGDRDAA